MKGSLNPRPGAKTYPLYALSEALARKEALACQICYWWMDVISIKIPKVFFL